MNTWRRRWMNADGLASPVRSPMSRALALLIDPQSMAAGTRHSPGQHRREQMHTDESVSDESSSGMRSLRFIVCSVDFWKRQSPFEDPLTGQSLPHALVLAEHFFCPCRDGMDGSSFILSENAKRRPVGSRCAKAKLSFSADPRESSTKHGRIRPGTASSMSSVRVASSTRQKD